MADTELKKLNKTVEDAVNILKMYVGNSAQVKNMNEKQRQAIEKWFDVGEDAEETIKKQRAFTERERDEKGRFFKKQEAMAFNFMGIAKSISGIFMGMAKGIGSAIGGIAKGITGNLSSLFTSIKGHFLSLFGEESEWFDILASIKDSIKGFFGWFARGFIMIFRRTPAWAGKMLKVLESMYSLEIKQAKMDMLGGDKKKKLGFLGILGMALFIAAALVGAWIKARLAGMLLIIKGFKIDVLWLKFKNWIKGIPKRLRAKFTWIDDITNSKFFRWIGKAWATFSETMGKFGKWLLKAPILGKILKGLKFGFKVLGWPLTIILGIVDFILGWRKSLGDWQDKLMGGLKNVFHGLLDLPLEILGWAWDKLMGLFGIKSKGTGAKLVKWFDTMMDYLLEFGPIGIITDIIKGFTSDEGFAGVFKRKFEKFQGVFLSIIDFVIDIWNGFLAWAAEKASWIPGAQGLLEGMALDRPINSPKALKQSSLKYYQEHEMRKLGLQGKEADELKDSVEEGTKATKDMGNKTEGAMQAITTIAQRESNAGVGSVETQQIPDELDNYIMNVKNYGGDFD
jgi:hypothetical protein